MFAAAAHQEMVSGAGSASGTFATTRTATTMNNNTLPMRSRSDVHVAGGRVIVATQPPRPKYRDPLLGEDVNDIDGAAGYGPPNIMFDPRVRRGSNISSVVERNFLGASSASAPDNASSSSALPSSSFSSSTTSSSPTSSFSPRPVSHSYAGNPLSTVHPPPSSYKLHRNSIATLVGQQFVQQDALAATLLQKKDAALAAALHAKQSKKSKPIAMARKRRDRLIGEGLVRPFPPSIKSIHESLVVQHVRQPVPMHLWLEEQVEPVPHITLTTQTDDSEWQTEEKTMQFVPRSGGVHAASQAYVEEMFDFEVECSLIVDTVCGKCIEQSLMEVREEEELRFFKVQQERMRAKAAREAGQAEDSVSAERERVNRHAEAVQRARARQAQHESTRHKLQAVHASSTFMRENNEQALRQLIKQNALSDPLATDAENFVSRDQFRSVDELVEKFRDHRLQAQGIIVEEARAVHDERNSSSIQDDIDSATISMYIHTDAVPQSPVGPIILSTEARVCDLISCVLSWLSDNISDDDRPNPEALQFHINGQLFAHDARDRLLSLAPNGGSDLTISMTRG